jgi:cytoskeleton protein RodZ
MANGTFGERLKRERDLREVSLSEIVIGTRIPEKFLLALENEQWDKLPGGVFTRGFVRSIARFLGLDEEDFLGEYDLARGPQVIAAPAARVDPIPSPPKWIPALFLLVVIGLCVGAFYGGRYAWHRYSAFRATRALAVQSAEASKTPDKLELTVSTSVLSHVRIYADDQLMLDGDILPGDSHHFTAAKQFQINAADGAAVHLELNGRPITARAALGAPSRTSDTIVLGYKDLRPLPDGSSRP